MRAVPGQPETVVLVGDVVVDGDGAARVSDGHPESGATVLVGGVVAYDPGWAKDVRTHNGCHDAVQAAVAHHVAPNNEFIAFDCQSGSETRLDAIEIGRAHV